MSQEQEKIAVDADVHTHDSGQRRPSHYVSDDQVDESLPELHHVPAEGPLDRNHFVDDKDERTDKPHD